MTMNYTSYSPFPSPSPSPSIRADDNFMISPAHGNSWSNRRINHEAFEDREGKDWGEGCSSSTSYDIAALLPADPFGMDLSSTLSAAVFAGFVWDFGANSANYNFYLEDAFNDWIDEMMVEFSTHETPTPEVSSYHEGLLFALGHLGVKDLLSVEGVCRSLCSAVRRDQLLWRCIHIDPPLNERITDEALLRLTQRAQGSLECLSLVDCLKITDHGLRQVLETNPKLKKLSVSGCRKLTIEGLINNLKAFKASSLSGIKYLKVGRLLCLLPEHYEELQLLLGIDDQRCEEKDRKLQFFHHGVTSSACDDTRAMDIEICPECQVLRYVYDCPSEICQEKGPDYCRACDTCIARCSQCGRCVKDRRYIENFFLDLVCKDCLEAQNQERMEE